MEKPKNRGIELKEAYRRNKLKLRKTGDKVISPREFYKMRDLLHYRNGS